MVKRLMGECMKCGPKKLNCCPHKLLGDAKTIAVRVFEGVQIGLVIGGKKEKGRTLYVRR